jgi:hypothetical protein
MVHLSWDSNRTTNSTTLSKPANFNAPRPLDTHTGSP